MPQVADRWNAERVRALPDDGNRYEVVDGALLVTPALSAVHQRLVLELAVELRAYVREHRLGTTMISPADLELDSQTLVQPDVFVVPLADRAIRHWSDIRTLLVAVEVVSPSSSRADRQFKRRRYQREGFAEYWVVDPDARLVERWRPSDDRPEILTDRLTWAPGGAEPLVIDLVALFEEVWEE